jgi:RNA polymerase sigma-70 factor, ECF subfamily
VDAVTFQTEAMKHRRLLWRVSWSMLGNREDCADAVQEALLRAWQRRDTLRNRHAFRPWLVRILANTCNDMLRKRLGAKFVPLEEENAAFEPPAEPIPLKEALERLSPEHRTVTVLHYLEGYSVAEIADMLSTPVGTIKSRMTYARRNLREILHDEVDI